MNVSKKLYISQKECFHTIAKSVIYDVKQSTGKNLPMQKLKGLKYRRKMSNGAAAETQITEFQFPNIYQFETTNRVNLHRTTYTVTEISDHVCEVTYKEEIEAEKWMQKMNNMLVGTIFAFLRKKRVTRLLKAMEDSVITASK
ncbi:DUF3284 domain-containing protein [Listeria cornellensis]|uniref:DUF3284 domain-containing protein n=1 Tax=Listeria cornellensis FSL F6-0969 TaxID=1265820 RepID=W7BDJ1_9LIST|nr:DUF3284 domain-containing protein [Listeria cornellensis]EUJ25214.1 hypothetical protein PCORN_18209 [Listeria cornellensis FSL F6-0969]